MNYKQRIINTLSGGGISVELEKGETIKVLYDDVAFDPSDDGFLDSEDASIYQVPTGKTFHGVVFKQITNAVASTVFLYSGDTENAKTLYKFGIVNPAIIGTHYQALQFTILTGKFITYNPQGTSQDYVEILGYETEN